MAEELRMTPQKYERISDRFLVKILRDTVGI